MYHFSQRRAGVLLHPTSLPSGTLDDAFRWLDFMADAGLSVWQVLPLGIPQGGLSPYQCLSAFAVNPTLLKQIAKPSTEELQTEAFLLFCKNQQHWLDDFTRFDLLKSDFNHTPWFTWEEKYRFRETAAMDELSNRRKSELLEIKWQQFSLHRYWQSILEYARERDIHLFGDMRIFVAHDSADVWAHPERFLLDDEGMPTMVTGVPPDYFSELGQRWGNPHYNWEYMQQENFSWWMDRLHHHFEWFDLVRIDHFRGLEAVWMIDAEEETAVNGHWEETPGEKLLLVLQQEMGEIPLVAEDLGIITPEVRALKQQFGLPGMSIMQFGFDHFDDNPHKPKNIGPDAVAYTGTHDNDTLLGWYRTLSDEMRLHINRELEIDSEQDVTESMIMRAFSSNASLAVIPLQDFLQLGAEARMNTPGTIENNWRWSFQWDQLDTELYEQIHHWVDLCGRGGENAEVLVS